MNACSSGGQNAWTEGNTWLAAVEGQTCNGAAKTAYTNGGAYPVGTLSKCHSKGIMVNIFGYLEENVSKNYLMACRYKSGIPEMKSDFGSLTAWRAEFVAMAKALAGGSGWAILAWSDRLGRLINHWAADHAHNLPGATPILAIDMYEHAYHLDFGAKAAAYVDQVMLNLNWQRIAARYRLAIAEGRGEDKLFLPYGSPEEEEARISAEELKAALEDDADRRPVLLDLCLPRDLARRTDMLAGARMHAPAALPRWIEELPRDRPIAAYCICGFQVSGNAVSELRRRGYDARALVGGITAWHAIGGATVPMDLSTYEEAQ